MTFTKLRYSILIEVFCCYENNLNSLDSLSYNDIEKIKQHLGPNKAHVQDKISIRMIQVCGKPIRKTLELITNQRTDTGSSPLKWGKSQRSLNS